MGLQRPGGSSERTRGITSPAAASRAVPGPRLVPGVLSALLAANRHLKGPRVLYRDNGQPATRAAVSRWMAKAQKRAGLPVTRALHVLRHTFCSRLAMRGAPAKAI